MIIVSLVVLVGLLGYVVLGFITVIGVIRRKVRRMWLLAFLAVPATWVGFNVLPIPGFTEGMRDGLRSRVTAERLQRFAAEIRSKKALTMHELREWPDPRWAKVKDDFPEIYQLCAPEARIGVGPDYVEIEWGSALTTHWGIRIGPHPFASRPIEIQEGTSCLEAYSGIWVYQDRW